MNTNPQVAIMMPVYNGERTLPLAIKSLETQTYQNWKCYIVNDGSTDNTKNILEAIKDDRFVVHHFNENKGRPCARQKALDLAEGKYMAMLDSDDFYHPKKLEIQVDYMENNPEISLFSLGLGAYKTIEEGLFRVRGINREYVKFHIGDNYTFIHNSSMLLLSEAKKHKFNLIMKRGQDMDFLRRYLDKKKYTTSDLPLYYISEFDSITKKKILYTYYLDLRNSFTLNALIFTKIKNSLTIFLKLVYFLLLYPFVSINYFLNKRGREANDYEKNEFEKCVNRLIFNK